MDLGLVSNVVMAATGVISAGVALVQTQRHHPPKGARTRKPAEEPALDDHSLTE